MRLFHGSQNVTITNCVIVSSVGKERVDFICTFPPFVDHTTTLQKEVTSTKKKKKKKKKRICYFWGAVDFFPEYITAQKVNN